MIDILYEDEHILVINKPPGLNSIQDGYNKSLPHVRSILEPVYSNLLIVHRLDKDTSGVLILAKNASIHRALNIQFTDRFIKKTYLALVFGSTPEQMVCALPLRINGDRKHRTIIDKIDGKPTSTEFIKLKSIGNETSLLEIHPKSGYTHQIRAHLLALGYPILGDPLYFSTGSSDFSRSLPIKRTALHSQSITFFHPYRNESITINAPVPDDFLQTIDYLTKK